MEYIKRIFSRENCIHPNSYFIRLTKKCNQNCVFCNVRGSFEEMPTEDAKEKIKEICGVSKDCTIQFTGGEPCLRDDLACLIKYAKKCGAKRVVMQTNAVLLSAKDYLENLIQAGLNGCIVSFHSHRKKTSQILSGVNNFEKNLEGIKNLINSKISVLLNIVLTKLNYGDLPQITEYILTELNRIDGIIFSVIQPHGKAFLNNEVVPLLSETINSLLKSIGMCKRNGMPYHISYCENPLCFILQLSEKGASKEAIEVVKRSISKNNCLNCRLMKEMAKEKTKFICCSHCQLKSYCGGVWKKYVEMYGEKEFSRWLIK